jgi:hypothetical protein
MPDVPDMPDVRRVLARLMTLSGETLLLAMEPADEGEFFAENADGFSAAWVLGHLACVADLFSSWFSGQLLFEESFHQVFNDTGLASAAGASKAAAVHPERYSKALLLYRFREAMVKAKGTLRSFDLARWAAPAPPGAPVTVLTCGEVWELLARHTDWHCGQLAGSMPRFSGTYSLNIKPHHLYAADDTPA